MFHDINSSICVIVMTQDFAQLGLRTLCLAVKEIDPEYFQEWKKRHHRARSANFHLSPLALSLIVLNEVLNNILSSVPICLCRQFNLTVPSCAVFWCGCLEWYFVLHAVLKWGSQSSNNEVHWALTVVNQCLASCACGVTVRGSCLRIKYRGLYCVFCNPKHATGTTVSDAAGLEPRSIAWRTLRNEAVLCC